MQPNGLHLDVQSNMVRRDTLMDTLSMINNAHSWVVQKLAIGK